MNAFDKQLTDQIERGASAGAACRQAERPGFVMTPPETGRNFQCADQAGANGGLEEEEFPWDFA